MDAVDDILEEGGNVLISFIDAAHVLYFKVIL